MRRALALCACLCLVFLPGAGIDLARGPSESGFLTYWEAKAAGLHVPPLPAETGIRVCTEEDYGPGFTSPQEAEKALHAYEERWGEDGGPRYCQEDPRKMVYMIMPDWSAPVIGSPRP